MTKDTLDSATTTLLLHGHTAVCRRAAAVEPEQLWVTIITVEEILTGWYAQIRRAKKDEQALRAYAALQQAVEFLRRIRIPAMDPDSLQTFHQFRKGLLRAAQAEGATTFNPESQDQARLAALIGSNPDLAI
jgi:tRNA(fMet)-specific endonuclease VapC